MVERVLVDHFVDLLNGFVVLWTTKLHQCDWRYGSDKHHVIVLMNTVPSDLIK